MKRLLLLILIILIPSALFALTAPQIYFASDDALRNMVAMRNLAEGTREEMQAALYDFEGLDAYTINNDTENPNFIPACRCGAACSDNLYSHGLFFHWRRGVHIDSFCRKECRRCGRAADIVYGYSPRNGGNTSIDRNLPVQASHAPVETVYC